MCKAVGRKGEIKYFPCTAETRSSNKPQRRLLSCIRLLLMAAADRRHAARPLSTAAALCPAARRAVQHVLRLVLEGEELPDRQRQRSKQLREDGPEGSGLGSSAVAAPP